MTDHHDEAEAYRNRAERAEQECAELRGGRCSTCGAVDPRGNPVCSNGFHAPPLDPFYLATALMAAQRKIDALQQHASALADSMLAAKAASLMRPEHWKAMDTALANWTAWLLDGKD